MSSDSSNELKRDSGIQFASWAEAFDSLDVAISIISPDLQLEYVNESYRSIVGIPADIGTGSSAQELYLYLARRGDFGEGDPEILARDRLAAISEGTWMDALQEMSDGRVIKIRRSVTNEGYVLTTITDITNIKKSETLVSTVLNSTDQGIIIVDPSGYVELLNAAFIDMFGFSGDTAAQTFTFQTLMLDVWKSGRFLGKIFGDDVNTLTEQEFSTRTIKFGELSLNEPLTIMLSSGTFVRFSSRHIENNRRIYTFTDITDGIGREMDIQRAKRQSENSLKDFSVVLNNMDVGLLLLDADMNALIINKAFHDFWDTDPEELPEGTHFRTMLEFYRHNGMYDIGDDEWEEYAQSRMAEVKAGAIASREITRTNGKTLIYSCTDLSDGKRLVSYSDISEFKNRESALKQAQLRAESADRSKSEFLANMSHEIRTPMNGVMGMAELLANTELNSKQKTFVDIILNSSTALLTIINDILDFSKIEAGKLELDPAPFRLREAIEDVATLISGNIIEKDVELIVRVQPYLVDQVVGDVGRFRQILTNLVGNAVRFTETGYVLVNLSGRLNGELLELECSVQDTGIGIPENQIDSVFEKFSQVDGSSTRRHEGTGLGLTIASRLVGLMGGKIGCRSVLGEGSIFWFTAKLQANFDAKPIITMPYDITGAHLLAIDDNLVNRSILLEQFEAWNLIGSAAASGSEGLAMLRQSIREGRPYDAIVLDYHMPDLNGLEVARIIRNDAQLKDTAIIMLTSVDNISEIENFRELNIEAQLTKPARASQLLEAIIATLRIDTWEESQPIAGVGHSSVNRNTIEPVEISTPPSKQFSHAGGDWLPKALLNIDGAENTTPVEETDKNFNQDSNNEANSDSQLNLRILVAEGNEVNKIVFSQILQHLRYSYKLVGNGRLAVEAVENLHPQLVLMDVSMPVMNGLDAAREIRQKFNGGPSHENYRPIIIGITAHALGEDRKMCLAAGMDDYITKPISPDMLIEKIKQWLPDNDGQTYSQFAN